MTIYAEKLKQLLSRLDNKRKRLHLYNRGNQWELPPVFFKPAVGSKVIEVVGSKGKTSVCFYLSAYLSKEARVGVFTSPHLITPNERIQIWQGENKFLISDRDFYELLSFVVETAREKGRELSYFEAIFFVAILWFSRQRCDYIVQEAGLGGRYDATNIVDNDFVVITRIELEHTNILGTSYEEILREKAAVVKSSTKRVFVFHSLEKEVYLKNVPSPEKIDFLHPADWKDFSKAVARCILGKDINYELNLQLPGRREFLFNTNERKLLVDVAHTPTTIQELMLYLPEGKWDIFFSIARDKKVEEILKVFVAMRKISRLYYVELSGERFLKAEEFLRFCVNRTPFPVYIISLPIAKQLWLKRGYNLVCGSHNIVAICLGSVKEG